MKSYFPAFLPKSCHVELLAHQDFLFSVDSSAMAGGQGPAFQVS
jgi:hypothetical protein